MFDRIGCNSQEYTRELGEDIVFLTPTLTPTPKELHEGYRGEQYDLFFGYNRKKNK